MVFLSFMIFASIVSGEAMIQKIAYVQNESFIVDESFQSARDPISCSLWARLLKPSSVVSVDLRQGCQFGHLSFHFPMKSGGIQVWVDASYVPPEEVLHFIIIKPGPMLDFSANSNLSPPLIISATFPNNLRSFLATIHQGNILLCSPKDNAIDKPTSFCYWLNVETSSMIQAPSTPISHSAGYMVSNGGHPWISGGYPTTWTSKGTDQSHVYTEKDWISGPKMPDLVVNHCIAQINATHFVLAGVGICDGNIQYETDQAWILDWRTQIWTPNGNISLKRRQTTCHSVTLKNGTNIAVFAGGRQYGQSVGLADVDIYNADSDVWIRGPDLPTPLVSHSSFVFNGTLFIVGGASNSIRNSEMFKLKDDLTGWDIDEGPSVSS